MYSSLFLSLVYVGITMVWETSKNKMMIEKTQALVMAFMGGHKTLNYLNYFYLNYISSKCHCCFNNVNGSQ